MYRIKLASGNETTFQSIDELTDAIQAGEIDGGALIYHQRADRWLSVTNHPHYQIALSRIQAPARPAATDASKRQIVSAVRPAAAAPAPQDGSNVPPTVARAQLLEVVAEMETSRAPRKLAIPATKKPETPSLRAHENVLEGVVIPKPPSTGNNPASENGTRNGAQPANGNHNGASKHQTTAMPYRGAAPSQPAKAATDVPGLDEVLSLLESAAPAPTQGNNRGPAPSDIATPQVDKLLSLLEPAPAKSTTPAPSAKPVDLEILDLGAPAPAHDAHRRAEPVLNGPLVVDQTARLDIDHQAEPVHRPIVARKRAPKPALIGLAAAMVLILGVVAWHPWSRAAKPAPKIVASTEAPRTEAFGGMTSVGNPANTSGQPNGATASQPNGDSARPRAADSAPAIIRVAAPRVKMNIPINTGALIGPAAEAGKYSIPAATLVQHYGEAYAEARSELELRMLQIGFTQIFLRSRLTTASGLQDTRRLINSANSALRQYRTQETRIERAFQDTVGAGGRNLDWTARDLGTWNTRSNQRESPETMRLTNLMLSQVDSVFSLLQNQDGKYQWSGDAIVFDDTDVARQYGALRAWLNQQADNYAGSGDAAIPGTLRQVIKAIGNTRLPLEHRR